MKKSLWKRFNWGLIAVIVFCLAAWTAIIFIVRLVWKIFVQE